MGLSLDPPRFGLHDQEISLFGGLLFAVIEPCVLGKQSTTELHKFSSAQVCMCCMCAQVTIPADGIGREGKKNRETHIQRERESSEYACVYRLLGGTVGGMEDSERGERHTKREREKVLHIYGCVQVPNHHTEATKDTGCSAVSFLLP